MRFMNAYEIDDAQARYRDHPILGPATATLANLRDMADSNSDGWCYWPKPARAASRLMEMITRDGTSRYRFDDEREDVTLAELRKAYAPIKAFRTRCGIDFEIVEPEKPTRAEIEREEASYWANRGVETVR